MKNSNKIFVMGGLLLAAALTACGGTGNSSTAGSSAAASSSTAATQEIHIQLVPSNDPATLLTRATALAPMLAKYTPGFTYKIDVGTTYAATTTALVNGQIDGGFLTASGYAQETIENAGKVTVLLSASRAGYKVPADDFIGFIADAKTKQLAAMNGEIKADGTALTKDQYCGADAYKYRGDQSKTEVSFYSGLMMSLRDSARTALGLKTLDSDGDGRITLKELHDNEAVIGIMGATSGAGYIYPSKTIYDAGYTNGFVSKADYAKLTDDLKAKSLISADQGTYPKAVDAMMTGTLDAVCGFMDIRYGSAFVQADSKYKGDEKLFTNTYTVAITDPIMNDTISVYSGLSAEKQAAIKTAFKAAVKDGSKDDVTTAAGLIYQIYSHTGYVDAKDADYDSARDMYRWTLAHSSK